ncbi:MAG TPA: peptidylprolyl isomerase [Kofleriaceae bacterium]|nr:peptidylprolyl isomerase [Kofleriaceae bacterium]
MVRRIVSLAATWLLAACPAPARPGAQPTGAEAALRIRVARAEARRAGGVAELDALATAGPAPQRALALRGLGRIGAMGAGAAGPPPIATLLAALGDPDPDVVGAAAGAIGVAASLDDGDPGATEALVQALGASPRAAGPILEALGRAGTVDAQPALIGALGDPRRAEQAALALARHGRRKLALREPARAALVSATAAADPAVRSAAVYALAREHRPGADPAPGGPAPGGPVPGGPVPAISAVTDALIRRLDDPVAEVRAQAIAGLGRRNEITNELANELANGTSNEPAVGSSRTVRIEALLLDPDWRVAVEAVRAIAGHGDHKALLATTLAQRYAQRIHGSPAEAQVILEAEKALADVPPGVRPVVDGVLRQLIEASRQDPALPPLTRGWIVCLAVSAQLHGDAGAELTPALQCPLPDALRLPLVAELITAGTGPLAARRAALAQLLGHADPKVRAAGLGALAAMWKAGDERDRRIAVDQIVAGLAAPDLILAGAAVDAATALYDAIASGDHASGDHASADHASADHASGDHASGDQSALDAAVIARAATEHDPELGASVLELVGKRKLASGSIACLDALTGDAVRAKAGAACLRALGQTPPPATPHLLRVAPAPPVDVATVIGHAVTWTVVTTRGTLTIRLHPEVAPWAVAMIVALTRQGFYDGLAFHRVVPDFVVQGGDPTESGSGGPGFTLPAEPASLGDGAGYRTGGVGIADAGRDSGGSQWFVMHSRAPHLDGRYTWFGTVLRGQAAAEALLIGDRVVRATVEVAP